MFASELLLLEYVITVETLAGSLLECVVECLVDFNSDGFNFTLNFQVHCVSHSSRPGFDSILGLTGILLPSHMGQKV